MYPHIYLNPNGDPDHPDVKPIRSTHTAPTIQDKAQLSGEDIPWKNDAYNDKMPEDVMAEQIKRQLASGAVGITGDGPGTGAGGGMHEF